MKVILKADVKGSGKKGDLIDVSDGYAKNFLLKKGLAEVATSSGINAVQQKRTADAYHKAENIKSLKELAATAQIASALSELGFDVDKKRITTKVAIKNVGDYEADVRLMEGVSATVKVKVIPA